MRVISRRRLREFSRKIIQTPGRLLIAGIDVAEKADWEKFADLKADYATADLVGQYVVINIRGNKYRLILEILL